MSEEIIQAEQVSPEVVYQQDKAQVDVQVATAKQYPRNIKRATDNAIAIVSMDSVTASTCNYSIPRGGKTISGPSVHLAKIIAQTWGNMRVEAKVVDVDNKHVTSQAVAFDLENNLAIKVEVKRSIMTKRGRMNDDMITVTGNAANSIALRNAVLAVVPKSVVDKVYRSAKETITGDVSSKTALLKKRKQVFDTLKDDYGVSEDEVLGVIGKPSISNITQEDLVTIIGIGQALRDGDTTVDEAFRPQNIKKTSDQIKAKNAEEEQNRIIGFINEATTLKDLKDLEGFVADGPIAEAYEAKEKELKKKK